MSDKNEYIVYVSGRPCTVTKALYEYIVKSNRQIKYMETERKQEKIFINYEDEKITVRPSIEDSFDRLTDVGVEFPDKSRDMARMIEIKITVDQALLKLDDEEKNLIIQLFYLGKTEREIALKLGVSQAYVHKQKEKVLCKLHEFLK